MARDGGWSQATIWAGSCSPREPILFMLNRRRHTASFTGGTEAGLSGRLKREGLTSRDQKRVQALPCPGRRGAQGPWWVEGCGARDALSDRLSVHLLSLMGQMGRGAETPGCSGVAGTEPFPALLREGPQRLWPTHSLPGGGRTGLQAELKRDPGACTSRWVGVCLLSRPVSTGDTVLSVHVGHMCLHMCTNHMKHVCGR